MKKETKHIIRTLGTILFILYVLALIYFLFFSEEYGRAAMEERQYRYNLIPVSYTHLFLSTEVEI